ncbi:MAG TPA: nucleotide exchange factor GrpE, partial [Streptosporangiaceae bacterium]|nr:nucleotide exchange factor GrpE [Streptosporangiaceae bacterium]
MSSPEESNTGPVIRDRRRIDPVTGQVKQPGMAAEGHSPPGGSGATRGSGVSPGQQSVPPGQQGRPRAGRHAASRPGGSSSRPGGTSAAGGPGG